MSRGRPAIQPCSVTISYDGHIYIYSVRGKASNLKQGKGTLSELTTKQSSPVKQMNAKWIAHSEREFVHSFKIIPKLRRELGPVSNLKQSTSPHKRSRLE